MAAAGTLRFRARTTGSSDAITVGTLSPGAWSFTGCRANSATDRSVFLNTEKANNVTSRSPSGMNRTSIGRSAESAGTSYANGTIALAALWAAGLACWPLQGVAAPEPDWVGRSEMAVTGAAKADNPRIFLPE
jgi:hypothetical protein